MEKDHRPNIVALRGLADLDFARSARKQASIPRGRELEAGFLRDPRWPAGWWILPFSVGGFVEGILLVLWLSGHL